VLHALGRHEDALKDMQGLMERWGQNDTAVKHAHHKADFELRKAKRPDYYTMLGCKKTASEGEIKQAYRMKALILHPDKHGEKPPEQQKVFEEQFKILGQALEVLSTPIQRQLYDEGYDRDAIIERYGVRFSPWILSS
jgi:DnaJ family protein C protein 7